MEVHLLWAANFTLVPSSTGLNDAEVPASVAKAGGISAAFRETMSGCLGCSTVSYRLYSEQINQWTARLLQCAVLLLHQPFGAELHQSLLHGQQTSTPYPRCPPYCGERACGGVRGGRERGGRKGADGQQEEAPEQMNSENKEEEYGEDKGKRKLTDGALQELVLKKAVEAGAETYTVESSTAGRSSSDRRETHDEEEQLQEREEGKPQNTGCKNGCQTGIGSSRCPFSTSSLQQRGKTWPPMCTKRSEMVEMRGKVEGCHFSQRSTGRGEGC
ncbi:hypothetical protein BDK51DRAFT_29300 [Blyttiomyces helicus]|uniref:Uncharacterized protein n=1 Tax=Blyttiomyces helicus TaxID=388810 RepID=A0A4P9WIV3_9FUNG|nr:hypothetical protein BDK51DRAFT_29300 [Blyttiomyces helicus]|eukprot:RKO91965.1 hypothetical protein BDK51DRAFT_29300 [Blyttiomyces helicus]